MLDIDPKTLLDHLNMQLPEIDPTTNLPMTRYDHYKKVRAIYRQLFINSKPLPRIMTPAERKHYEANPPRYTEDAFNIAWLKLIRKLQKDYGYIKPKQDFGIYNTRAKQMRATDKMLRKRLLEGKADEAVKNLVRG